MMKETAKRMVRKSGFDRTARALRRDISQLSAKLHTSNVLKETNPDPDMVFIWIPKTAGTSVYEALHTSCGMKKLKTIHTCFEFPQKGAVTFGHMSYNELLQIGAVQKDYSKRAYKFSFVRCPYDRAISLYNYLRQGGVVENGKSFNEFLDDVHRKRPGVGLYNQAGLSQANPQVDWLIGTDGNFVSDEIFKVENIGQFSDEIKRRFGIALDIQKSNISEKHVTFDEIKDQKEVLEKIEEIYSRDFCLLDFQKVSKLFGKISRGCKDQIASG